MERYCGFCGWNPTRAPDPQNGLINNNVVGIVVPQNMERDPPASLYDMFHDTRPEIIEANLSLPAVFYNPNDLAYNMSGDKLNYIFWNENYDNNGYFKHPPSRNGTRDEADLLMETFDLYGFRFKIYYDMKCEQILDVISRVSQQDHTRTSCLWVTIMSHATSDALLAADRPYRLSQIEKLLQSANLAGIPKILTLPCIRGGNEMPGFFSRQPPQIEGSLCALPYNAAVNLWYGSAYWLHKFYYQVFKKDCENCPVCSAHNVDDGRTVLCASGKTIVLPSTADFLFIHAANNDLMSFRILIRAICEAFQEHQELQHGDLIPVINQKVANNTDPTEEKVIPETRITLTKILCFKRSEPRPQLVLPEISQSEKNISLPPA